MKETHQLGSIGEARVMFEALRRNYVVSIPHGHDARYDLIVDRKGKLERIQVKTVTSNGEFIKVQCRSVGKQNGAITAKLYTSLDIDWIVVYDITTDMCVFVPSADLGGGKYQLNLRVNPSKNNQKIGVRWAKDYKDW